MARPSPTTAHYRAKIAALSRCVAAGEREPDDPDLAAAHTELKLSKIADYVAKVVSELPPLTDEQRDRIAALLRAGAVG